MENEMKQVAQFYKDKKISVHLKLQNGSWLNGKIISIAENNIILEEEFFGEMIILIKDIIPGSIVPRIEKENRK